jgi:hypothetical protein
VRLEHRNPDAGMAEQVRRNRAGDAGTHNDEIDTKLASLCWVAPAA